MSVKLKKIYIDSFKGFKNFSMDINENITVLVGENGTGKTTILEIIYNILSGNIEYFSKVHNFTNASVILNDGKCVKIAKENDTIKRYIDTNIVQIDNEVFTKRNAIYFPAEGTFKNYEIKGPSKLDMVETNISLNADQMSKELKQFLINEKYLDLNDIAEGKQDNAIRIEKYKKIYNDFLTDKKFIGIDNSTFEPIFELNDTLEHIDVNKLSLGEKQIFYKGGSLIQYGENDEIVVLIDEPETSMHPEWQQRILEYYKNINSKAQFIFVTHSPHIVSSCSKEEIRLIVKKDNTLSVDEDIVNTYGLNNEEILFNVFGLDSVRDIKVQQQINEYKGLFSKGELLTEEEKKKMNDLKVNLESSVGLSKSDIALLEFESNTEKFKEMFKELGDK